MIIIQAEFKPGHHHRFRRNATHHGWLKDSFGRWRHVGVPISRTHQSDRNNVADRDISCARDHLNASVTTVKGVDQLQSVCVRMPR